MAGQGLNSNKCSVTIPAMSELDVLRDDYPEWLIQEYLTPPVMYTAYCNGVRLVGRTVAELRDKLTEVNGPRDPLA